MKLIPVDKNRWNPVTLRCIHCGVWKDSSVMLADIEGEPLKAYYCPDCAKPSEQGEEQ